MSSRKMVLIFLLLLSFLLSCQQAKESNKGDQKLHVIATIFPIYDFARNIGGDKVKVTMLLPPGTDAHHYELKPEDIVKVSKTDIFLFTNFEMEQWAYKIINAAEKNTNMLAIETGAGAVLLPLNEEEEKQENDIPDLTLTSGWIWITPKRWLIISQRHLLKRIHATVTTI